MKIMSPTGGLLLGLCAFGCGDAAVIKQKAAWLCEHDHLEHPLIDMFPEDHPPVKYVAAKDLAAIARQQEESDNPFAALAVGLKQIGVGARAAVAEHTTCDVKVSVDASGEQAVADVKQEMPDWEPQNPFKLMGELASLGSSDEARARVSEMIREAKPPTKTVEQTLKFVRQDGEWVVLYDIERGRHLAELETKLKKAHDELKSVDTLLSEAEGAAAVLARFEVKSARFSSTEHSFGMRSPRIDLTVKNGTDAAVSRASFIGNLASAGRSVPWIREPFSYSIPGGLEPGETATWSLAPNAFSEWGTVDAPSDAVLSVEVTALEGANEKTIAEFPRDPDDFLRSKTLDIATLSARRAELTAALAELEEEKAKLL